jgi:hypothetical protein
MLLLDLIRIRKIFLCQKSSREQEGKTADERDVERETEGTEERWGFFLSFQRFIPAKKLHKTEISMIGMSWVQ